MRDYSLFYRRSVDTSRIAEQLSNFDIYISAYNSSDRVLKVFEEIRAQTKIWHIHPEYNFRVNEEPAGHLISRPGSLDEKRQVDELLSVAGDLNGKHICIDTTGFMRHVLVLLVAKLAALKVRVFTALYSEPNAYKKQENTAFSTTTTGLVRPVKGMGGSNRSLADDLLIVGVGFDHRLINEVTNSRDDAVVHPVFGFPSLSADMYQQSAVKASESGAVAFSDEWTNNRRFAPANDPFATAEVVADIVEAAEMRSSAAHNIYLSPLSTKAQTLGFALFWHFERNQNRSIVMLTPECLTYSRETSEGLRRLWAYTVEL
jgi:hypothetical protein